MWLEDVIGIDSVSSVLDPLLMHPYILSWLRDDVAAHGHCLHIHIIRLDSSMDANKSVAHPYSGRSNNETKPVAKRQAQEQEQLG